MLCACWPCFFFFFKKNVYPGLLLIFKLLAFKNSCSSYLYILEMDTLSVISFANIFSHSKGCHFVLSVVPFTVQTHLRLIINRLHLFTFLFVSFSLVDRSKKKNFCNLCQGVIPVFFSRSFMASGLTLGS